MNVSHVGTNSYTLSNLSMSAHAHATDHAMCVQDLQSKAPLSGSNSYFQEDKQRYWTSFTPPMIKVVKWTYLFFDPQNLHFSSWHWLWHARKIKYLKSIHCLTYNICFNHDLGYKYTHMKLWWFWCIVANLHLVRFNL